MPNKQIKIHSPLDMHIHFRDREMMKVVAPLSAYSFAGGVIMPNLIPPVDNIQYLQEYKVRLTSSVEGYRFEPFLTVFFRDYSYEELEQLKPLIIGVKLYPAGVTTNSETGVQGLEDVENTIGYLEKLDIPLMIHGETKGFVLEREKEFLPVYERLAKKFPKLKIIMEHITTAKSLETLDRYDNLFATITLYHLLITLNDLAGGLLKPHLFCKPIAKKPEDRQALINAAINAHPKVMFGSDSAPHSVDKKECAACGAGVFTAPIALQGLVDLFDKHDALENLQLFVSNNAQRIYGIEPIKKTVVLERTPYKVPHKFGNVVPMFAGSEIPWSICEIIT
ncbi:MAG: dihydroorotase [Xenococcaceae cyanobacterium MO_207.B15]|nr:dihydroorotase [Xenococcaceae cyanobacterium MO_207.B15]